MKATTIDFGTFTRPNGETLGRLILDISESGRFSLSHMVTPHEGTIVAHGEFKEYIKGLPDAAVAHLSKLVVPPPNAALKRKLMKDDEKYISSLEAANAAMAAKLDRISGFLETLTSPSVDDLAAILIP